MDNGANASADMHFGEVCCYSGEVQCIVLHLRGCWLEDIHLSVEDTAMLFHVSE